MINLDVRTQYIVKEIAGPLHGPFDKARAEMEVARLARYGQTRVYRIVTELIKDWNK
jgi:hypothetical protein